MVAGLDRGLAAASSSETEEVEKAAAELEAAFAEDKSEGGFDTNLEDRLQGRWRLVYSSGFASTGSLGGRRPGPPAAVVPPLFKLGQVPSYSSSNASNFMFEMDIPVGKSILASIFDLQNTREFHGYLTSKFYKL